MSKTINILGDTKKEQWLNAIMIFEMSIHGNMSIVHGFLEDEADNEYLECCEIAMRNTKNFADEMRRLVEGIFNDD